MTNAPSSNHEDASGWDSERLCVWDSIMLKIKRQRRPWTIEVTTADRTPLDVESFLPLYAKLLIELERKTESSSDLKMVA